VLSVPSWWTRGFLPVFLGILGFLVVAGSIWIEIRYRRLMGMTKAIRDSNAKEAQGIARDIAQRERTELELRSQGEKLRTLLAARDRLGRDLHDGIIQSIYAVGLALEDCRRTIATSSSEAGDKIAKCVRDLNHVIREVRGFIAGLGSDSLTGTELATALKSLVLTMNESGGCGFVLQVDASVAESLTARQATQFLYVAREAMSNSLRHGRALSTLVTLEARDGDFVLEVRDDGQGFNPANPQRAGRGLLNMESRAIELGASFAINSAPGKGTVVTVRIPANPSDQEADTVDASTSA
jgi:signal transduction histidine kinase